MASSRGTRRSRSVFRRLERVFVGFLMAIMAFILEKAVMRSVKKKGRVEADVEPTTLTSRGGEVDLPD